ncbi:MAG: PfkB family carbohydrate kinase [Pirellulaceae bacterium]
MARSEWDDDDANWGGPVVIAAGEILWDLFPDGPRLGGAPANFACHAAALGAESWLVSAVGNDERGAAAIAQFGELGLQTDAIFVDSEHPTGTVDVTVDSQGVASFQFAENCAWDHLPMLTTSMPSPTRPALCFGTLGQRGSESRATIQKLVDGLPWTKRSQTLCARYQLSASLCR